MSSEEEEKKGKRKERERESQGYLTFFFKSWAFTIFGPLK